MQKALEFINIGLDTLPETAYEFSDLWRQKLTIKKGERVLITAPSGKGKSSLISLIYGLKRNYSGVYKINGFDVRHFNAASWAETRAQSMSVVFQDLRLFTDYSGWENLAIKGKLTGAEFDKDKILEMAQQLGIENLLSKNCGHMSFGERQRLAIVRSLLMTPDFLIMDEPFSHLDEMNTMKAVELIDKTTNLYKPAVIITSLGSSYNWNFDRNVLL